MKLITDGISNFSKRTQVYKQIFESIATHLPNDFDEKLLSSMLKFLDMKWLGQQLDTLTQNGIYIKAKQCDSISDVFFYVF